MQSKSFRGLWWSPNHRDVHIDINTDLSTIPDGSTAGIVKYEPTSPVEIELIGELGRPEGTSEVEYIHGMTTEGNKITISDCIAKNRNKRQGSGFFLTETWTGHNIFYHEHTLDGRFEKIVLSFPNLEHWTDIGSLDRAEEDDQYDPRREVREANGEEFSLKFIMSEFPSPHGSSTYPDSAVFEFDLSSPQSYETISTEYIYPLRNFLSLAMNESVFPEKISNGQIGNATEIYPFYIHHSDVEEIYPSSMSFTLDDIEFEDAILEWFSHHNDIRVLHDMYFSSFYHDDMYLELEFLSLLIGLETYHRRTFSDDYHMEDLPYEAFREAAKERLPDVPAKGRTINLLRSIGNDYSLKKRLESVVSDHRSILDEIIDVDETLRESTNLRHELAHGLTSDYDTNKLSRVSSRLRAVCEVLLLKSIGLNKQTIEDSLIPRYRRHKHFKGEPPEHIGF